MHSIVWHKSFRLLVFASLLLRGTVWSQGIIHTVPLSPLYYSDLLTSKYIDVNSDGVDDFVLTTPNGMEINLNPLGNNAVLAVPEPPPDLGVLVSALTPGTAISSSLAPQMVWYDRDSPYGGSATIIATSTIGDIGYFRDNTNAYAGFRLNLSGNMYYGWFYIQNLGANIGQITSWAYESAPNTPILAGAVPEPSTFALIVISSCLLSLLRRKNCKHRQESD